MLQGDRKGSRSLEDSRRCQRGRGLLAVAWTGSAGGVLIVFCSNGCILRQLKHGLSSRHQKLARRANGLNLNEDTC